MMQWFRLYSRIIDDKKIKLLAFEDRWHFVALCCLKSSGELDETDADLKSRQVAVALGVQLAELDEILRRLRAVKLIDSNMHPLNWEKLQFKRDNSTDRVREYRKRQQKQSCNNVKRDETVSETRPDKETDSEEELEPKGSCASGDALKPEHVVSVWNEKIAPALGKPIVRKLTPERRVKLKARIAGFTVAEFREVISNIMASPFLRGDTGWHGFSFDWFTKKANFVKILEGNYNG
jgi:hypothetical protein